MQSPPPERKASRAPDWSPIRIASASVAPLPSPDRKHGDAPAARPADRPAAPESSPHGRQVVAGITRPCHSLSSRRWIGVTTAVSAMAACAGFYAGVSGISLSNADEPDAYQPHAPNVGISLAGAVVVGLLPAAIAWSRYGLRRLREVRLLARGENGAPNFQLERIVQNALGDAPLTRDGMNAAVERVGTLLKLQSTQERDAAVEALARLAAAAAAAPRGCAGRCDDQGMQLDLLVQTLESLHHDNAITTRQFKQALITIPETLHDRSRPTPEQAGSLAAGMLDTMARLYEGTPVPQAQALALANLRTLLRGHRYFPSGLAALEPQQDLQSGLPGPHAPRREGKQDEAQPIPMASPDVRMAVAPESPGRGAQQGLGAEGSTDAKVHQALIRAAREDLPGTVEAAIRVARSAGWPAVVQATRLVTILDALRSRTDLAPGIFLGGLLAPEEVVDLIGKTAPGERYDLAMVNRLLTRLPMLCQLGLTPEVVTAAKQRIRTLDALPPLRLRVTQSPVSRTQGLKHLLDDVDRYAGQRIVVDREAGRLGERLHLAWLPASQPEPDLVRAAPLDLEMGDLAA